MKKIKIIFDNHTETLLDEDETNLEDYLKLVSSLISSGNVNIIQTTTGENLIVRPSKVLAIKVSEYKTEEKKIETSEDTVTD